MGMGIPAPFQAMYENEVSPTGDKLEMETHLHNHPCQVCLFQKCFRVKITHHNHPFLPLPYLLYQTWHCIKIKKQRCHFHSTKKGTRVIVISRQVLSSQGTCMEVVWVKYLKCLEHFLVTRDHQLQVNNIFIRKDINMDTTFPRIHLERMLIQIIVLKVQVALVPPMAG